MRLLCLSLSLLSPCGALVLSGRLPGVRGADQTIRMAQDPQIRIGHGYDIHRLASREEAGQPIVIVVDAILGALTMPDIGQLFPDNDPKLKSADSEIFMEEADRVRCLLNARALFIQVEHKDQQCKQLMIDNMVRLLRSDPSRVNVKARTHEKVDSVGECRAVECHVVLTLERDRESPTPQEPIAA
ncbi:MAG: hypothetical protein SGPRY_000706 [Prymnesium sp.]